MTLSDELGAVLTPYEIELFSKEKKLWRKGVLMKRIFEQKNRAWGQGIRRIFERYDFFPPSPSVNFPSSKQKVDPFAAN